MTLKRAISLRIQPRPLRCDLHPTINDSHKPWIDSWGPASSYPRPKGARSVAADSVGNRVFGVFGFGELFRELVKLGL
jgi:hypothetical protein